MIPKSPESRTGHARASTDREQEQSEAVKLAKRRVEAMIPFNPVFLKALAGGEHPVDISCNCTGTKVQ